MTEQEQKSTSPAQPNSKPEKQEINDQSTQRPLPKPNEQLKGRIVTANRKDLGIKLNQPQEIPPRKIMEGADEPKDKDLLEE